MMLDDFSFSADRKKKPFMLFFLSKPDKVTRGVIELKNKMLTLEKMLMRRKTKSVD